VAFYMRQVFRKLNIGSRVELTRIVVEQTQQNSAEISDLPTARRLPASFHAHRSASPALGGPKN
jgi:hypothetical protein